MVYPLMSIFEERARFSKDKLRTLRDHLKSIDASPYQACVYTTGSVARGEASPTSDLDLFIVDTADEGHGELALSNIQASLLRADLIRAGSAQGFPPFSGDGIYLEVHRLRDLVGNTGNRLDDYSNSFTARLLLMLESKPVLNKQAHKRARELVVASYWRDYEDNDKNFLPVFLVNDVIRYWKTIALNYESERHGKAPTGYDSTRWKRRNRLKDIKLKFSRKWTTHSTVIHLLAATAREKSMTPGLALEMIDLTPLERFMSLRGDVDPDLVDGVVRGYEWFLENVPGNKEDAHDWVGEQDNWMEARSRGEAFGSSVNLLLEEFRTESPLYKFLIG